ncbi:invasion associated locus B family protein [Microvirga sp. ACRRW]|uniref:invasion associated locus B family protein n=1 Tax=Microvirga sp. ACRRW TaxID=2918205 RepID=UPI001EF6D833|nr:invasion associated locus B family protein [Microvirga sp. ACRRW]MCG7393199.1 invasion associated locus B family protein [Microvirga sp. ACRRW]
MKFLSTVFAFLVFSSTCAFAQNPHLLGANERWSAWKAREGNAAVCYAFSDAASKKPENLDHGRVTLFVRQLGSGKVRTEASLQTGYAFAPVAIRISIDGQEFTMIPRGNYAWLRRTEREAEFVRALEKGRVAVVEATSRRGNKTTYAFPLKGFTAMIRKARRECR